MPRRPVLPRAATLAVALATLAPAAGAQSFKDRAAPPARDLPGTRDTPVLPRYQGAVLIESSAVAYDEVSIPRATLVRQGTQRDPANNAYYADPNPIKLEGRRTRLVYALPLGRSPLEAIRGYQQVARAGGGQVLYECAAEACGGDVTRGADAGGSSSGLIQLLYPRSAVTGGLYTPRNCGPTVHHADQRYTAVRLRGGAVAGVLSYRGTNGCDGAWTDRTAVIVLLGEPAAREDRMETVSADAMAGGMASEGKVALYALFFDTGKADLKPESTPQLAEMASYLKRNPAQRVLVVGHTDNQGALAANVDLSRRRAQAVADALVRTQGTAAGQLTPQGVGMAAPVATNQSEAGRAKNRRVELVQQ